MGKKPIVSVTYKSFNKKQLNLLKMCVTSLLCGPRADLWPFQGFLCKRFSLYILNEVYIREKTVYIKYTHFSRFVKIIIRILQPFLCFFFHQDLFIYFFKGTVSRYCACTAMIDSGSLLTNRNRQKRRYSFSRYSVTLYSLLRYSVQ